MGDFISMSEALLVAVVSILVVFVVLIVIAIIINGLKAFGGEKKQDLTISTDETSAGGEKLNTISTVEDSNEISEELVAVISAAVAVNLGSNIPEINIKSIRRIPQMTSGWSNAGTIKQVSKGL